MSQLRPLRIAVVSRGDATIGGSGRVADELCEGLRGTGHEVHRFLRRTLRSELPANVTQMRWRRGEIGLLNAAQVDLGSIPLLRALHAGRFDVVHFHDHVLAWGTRIVAHLAEQLPVVLTFHDSSGFTGGCMVPNGCTRMLLGCGDCPQVGTGPLRLPIDRTRATWRMNRVLARHPNVAAVSPSRFYASLAEQAAWREYAVHVVPNGVDSATFSPERRDAARRRLGLEEGERVLLFVAADVSAPHKGAVDLAEAWATLRARHSAARVWLVGDGTIEPAPGPGEERRWVCLGRQSDPAELADRYAAADLLVVPSHQDNLPCTVAEALASGTPVVAYPTGGIPEMFDASCGRLASERTPAALAAAIEDALVHLCNPTARAAARAHALREFAPEVFVERHVALYRERIADFRAP